MNDLTIFNYRGRNVRTLTFDDEPWFVGKDVAEVLGYSNTRKVIQDHVDEEDKMDGVTIRDAIGREQNVVAINESGLYSLIMSSKLPSAKEFKRWVTHEVLPSIRKTGSYSIPSCSPYRELTTDDYLRAASIVATCRKGRLPLVVDLLKKGGIEVEQLSRKALPAYAFDGAMAYEALRTWILSSPSSTKYNEDGEFFCLVSEGRAYIPRALFNKKMLESGCPTGQMLSYLRSSGLLEIRAGKGFTRSKRINGVPTDCVVLKIED